MAVDKLCVVDETLVYVAVISGPHKGTDVCDVLGVEITTLEENMSISTFCLAVAW